MDSLALYFAPIMLFPAAELSPPSAMLSPSVATCLVIA